MNKVKQFQQLLAEKNIDFCILFNTSNFKKDYFATYFSSLDLELFFVIIPKKKKPFVIVSNLEIGRAKKLSAMNVIGFEKDLFGLLKEKIGLSKRLGANFSNVSLNEAKLLKKHLKAKLVDVTSDLKEYREHKSDEEIGNIKRAARIGDEIFKKTIENFRNFKTELDVKNFMDKEIRAYGCEPAFETTINSGSNASYGHYSTSSEKLKKGFCIIDFGVKSGNYNSDMTRTVYIGNPSKKELETYQRLKEVQQECIDSTKVGVKYKELDKIARDAIGKNLIHALGHGLGIEVHEGPNVGPNSIQLVEKGHVFTIEPGEYVAGKYGIRIEDDVAIDNKGKVRVLTNTEKELIIIN